MKLNTKLPEDLKAPFQAELSSSRLFFTQNEFAKAWNHLEHAHVIGQAYPLVHTHVHWLILKFGFTIKSRKEILGQIPRLLVGGVKSFVGVIPVGNTGGSNVPPLRAMDIPADLQKILRFK